MLKMSLLCSWEWASQALHGYAVKIGLEWDVFVAGALVNIYAKFGRIREPRVLFDGMPLKDAILWNVMIRAYVKMGLQDEALLLFAAFHRSGLRPDDTSVRSVLLGAPRIDLEWQLMQVRAYATKLLQFDVDPEVVLCNKTLSEYLKAGQTWKAIDYFADMIKSQVAYDSMTLLVMLSVVLSIKHLDMGKQIHGVVVKLEYDRGLSVANSLLNMYMKAGSVRYALVLFSQMRKVDVISWNTMISGCALNGSEEMSLRLLVNLLQSGLSPDEFTIASVLRACSSLQGCFYVVRMIHTYAIKAGIIFDSFISTSLIDVYSKSGNIEEAEFLFHDQDGFDLASWNAMMHGYMVSNSYHKALGLFIKMHKNGEGEDPFTLANAAKAVKCLVELEKGKQIHAVAIKRSSNFDLFVISCILDMYVKCGEMESACRVFSEIYFPDDVAWTTMISGCVENGYEKRALFTYWQMRLAGVQPDNYTFATLVKASSLLASLEQGRQIHADIIKLNYALDPYVITSLVDMYAKSGNIEAAYRLFKRTKVKSIALWNAMIVGLAQHGSGKEVLYLFEDMKSMGAMPDKVTFKGVLSACSYSGLISEAYEVFHSMQRDHGIEPEIQHYSYLVDSLSRAGRIQEAENLILSTPFEASASMYRILLNACRIQGDNEMGQIVAEKLFTLDPFDSAVYVLLSNIYKAANQWEDATSARNMMKRANVKKDPGFGWIDVKNKVVMFVAGDRSYE